MGCGKSSTSAGSPGSTNQSKGTQNVTQTQGTSGDPGGSTKNQSSTNDSRGNLKRPLFNLKNDDMSSIDTTSTEKKKITDYTNKTLQIFNKYDNVKLEKFLGVIPPPHQIDFKPDPNLQPKVSYANKYKLHFAFGYRCQEAQNLFYLTDDNIVYPTAALGVKMKIDGMLEQSFFGGGRLEEETKFHFGDIISLKCSGDKKKLVTGELGGNVRVIVWNTQNQNYEQNFDLGISSIGVAAIGVNKNGSMIAVADLQKSPKITILPQKESLPLPKSGRINDIAFCEKDYFVAAGEKGNLLVYQNGSLQSLVDGSNTNYTCIIFGEGENFYVGDDQGNLHHYNETKLLKSYKLETDRIGSVNYSNGQLLVGGFKLIFNLDPQTCDAKSKKIVNDLASSIDINSRNQLLVGLRNGTIIQSGLDKDIVQEVKVIDPISTPPPQKVDKFPPFQKENDAIWRTLMHAHYSGELTGMDLDGEIILTSGEDNRILLYDVGTKMNIVDTQIDREQKPLDSFFSNGLITNYGLRDVAIISNEGKLLLRRMEELEQINKMKLSKAPNSKVTCLCFSMEGDFLAVGCQDNKIYIYETSDELYTLVDEYTHEIPSPIIEMDWSFDTKFLRFMDCDFNIDFIGFDLESKKIQKADKNKLRDYEWMTANLRLGWNLETIYEQQGRYFVTCVELPFIGNQRKALYKDIENKKECRLRQQGHPNIAVGYIDGIIASFGNPALKKEDPLIEYLMGHSSPIRKIKYSSDAKRLYTAGSTDKTVIVWKQT